MRCYNERTTIFTQSGQYKLQTNCNGYIAVNNGDTIVQVNRFPLKPPVLPTLSGESTGVVGNQDETFTGDNGIIQISFLTPMGANPSVIIKEKFYVNS